MAARTAPRNVRQADDFRVSPEASSNDECRSLRRGLMLLDAIRQSGEDGMRVVALCRACGLERATVHRLLATLIDCRKVQQLDRYRYVAAVPAATARGDIASDAARRLAPVLARVSRECGDASFAVVREGHSAWCVARQIGTYPIQMLTVQVGSRQPLGVGASGLALLSALTPADADAAIDSHGEALERYGGMTAARLRLLVAASRERGWSVVGNHAVPGVLGVGRALAGPDGRPIAGISVAASIDRMTAQRQRLIAKLMRDALDAFHSASVECRDG